MNHAVINAARIAFELKPGPGEANKMNSEVLEEVESAAIDLGSLETEGLKWEDQKRDWESICAEVARQILAGLRNANWKTIFQTQLKLTLPARKPTVYVSISPDNDRFVVFVPKNRPELRSTS